MRTRCVVRRVTGKDVVILCHNEALTTRDERASKPFLNIVGTHSKHMGTVKYCTFMEMVSNTQKSKRAGSGSVYGFGELVDAILDPSNSLRNYQFTSANGGDDTILLIDEVDVIFGDLYDRDGGFVTLWQNDAVKQIQLKLFEEQRELTTEEIEGCIRSSKSKGDNELWDSTLFQTHLGFMNRDVKDARTWNEKTRLNPETEKLEVWYTGDANNQSWRQIYYGYLNAFKYLQLREENNLQLRTGPGCVSVASTHRPTNTRAGPLERSLCVTAHAQLMPCAARVCVSSNHVRTRRYTGILAF